MTGTLRRSTLLRCDNTKAVKILEEENLPYNMPQQFLHSYISDR